MGECTHFICEILFCYIVVNTVVSTTKKGISITLLIFSIICVSQIRYAQSVGIIYYKLCSLTECIFHVLNCKGNFLWF